MSGTDENLDTRLRRLSERWHRSKAVFEDDTRALHDVVEEAEGAGHSVRWISGAIDQSPTHTFRIIHALTGPRSRD